MTPLQHQPDPRLDLFFERIIDVPRELAWKAWTSPEHLKLGSRRCHGKQWIAKSISVQGGCSGL